MSREQLIAAARDLIEHTKAGTVPLVDDVMRVTGPKRHVVFFTVKVERPWQDGNNKIITDSTKQYKNAKVLDWHYFGTHIDQKKYFYCEFGCALRLHLTPDGRKFYTKLIIDTLRKWHWLPQ